MGGREGGKQRWHQNQPATAHDRINKSGQKRGQRHHKHFHALILALGWKAKKSTDLASAFMSCISRWMQKLLIVACRSLLGVFFRQLLCSCR
jgi:hypothetical protein